MSEMREFYEEYLRHLETPEFVAWFETWYAKPDEYKGHESHLDAYYSERRFALAGWLAAKTEGAHLMSKSEFVATAMPRKNVP